MASKREQRKRTQLDVEVEQKQKKLRQRHWKLLAAARAAARTAARAAPQGEFDSNTKHKIEATYVAKGNTCFLAKGDTRWILTRGEGTDSQILLDGFKVDVITFDPYFPNEGTIHLSGMGIYRNSYKMLKYEFNSFQEHTEFINWTKRTAWIESLKGIKRMSDLLVDLDSAENLTLRL